MKTILLIIALSLAVVGESQTKGEKIWQYVEDHMGQKIGSGICDEVVIYAYQEVCGCMVKEKIDRGHAYYSFGDTVSVDSIQKGDIVDFSYFNKKTGKEINGHVGIVYSFGPQPGGYISVANQNNGLSNTKKTYLMIDEIDNLTQSDKYRCVVTFYRPK